MIGDRWRDIDTGATCDRTTSFFECGDQEQLRERPLGKRRLFLQTLLNTGLTVNLLTHATRLVEGLVLLRQHVSQQV